jgi:phosphoribosyl-AMP cyclohydrolase
MLGGSVSNELEEGTDLELDFTKLNQIAACGEDVLPVAVQDAETGDVLLVGYANRLALETTLEKKMATFWSTSRNELWIKGATSGDTLEVVDVSVNCEQNSLLYRVKLKGKGACHTKGKDDVARHGCYYRKISGENLTFV